MQYKEKGLEKMDNSREKKEKEFFTFFKNKKQADSKSDISNFTFFKNEGVKSNIQEIIPKERSNIRNFKIFKNEPVQKESKSSIFFPSRQQKSNRDIEKKFFDLTRDSDRNQIHDLIEKSDELLYINNNKKQELSKNLFFEKLSDEQNEKDFFNKEKPSKHSTLLEDENLEELMQESKEIKNDELDSFEFETNSEKPDLSEYNEINSIDLKGIFDELNELININEEIDINKREKLMTQNPIQVKKEIKKKIDLNISNFEDNYSNFEVKNGSKPLVEKIESRFIPEIFCSKLVEFIKKNIGIDNNEFNMYTIYIKINSINTDLIINNLFQEATIINLLQQANIRNNKNTLIQAKRCTQIISLALFKYDNDDDLLKNLLKLTKLTQATLWSQIKKYIPILKILNPNIDIKRWLPHSKDISYNLLKEKVEALSKRITGIIGTLIKPKNESEWLLMIKNKKRKSQIPIIVKCNQCNVKFNSRYNYIERERWNCNCTKTLYDSELVYDFNRLKKEIEELGKEITGIKGTLLTPSSEDEYIKMRLDQSKSPTQLNIKVKCNKCGKIWKTSVTSLIHHKNWCGRCTDPRVYSYTDILNLVKLVTLNTVGIEGILKSPENQEKFKILANKYIPSHIPLIIECGNCGNELSYITQYLKAGFFPCSCINLKYETILSWYLFKMFGFRFNHTPLQKMISSYSGKLEYDGFNNIKLNNNNIGLKKIKNYSIENPILNNISSYRTFKYNESEIDDFIKSFEKNEFKYGDNIFIDLSYGHLKFIYKNKKIILVKSQLHRTKKIFILNNILKFAFEYNGRQHYEFPNAFHKKFEEFLKQVINDLIKTRLSNENNIFLMIFPYWIDLKMNDPTKIQNYITKVIYSQVGLDLTSLQQYDHRDPSFGQYRLDKFTF